MGPLDIMLSVAAGATNGTNPDAVLGAAQTATSFSEAATNAQAIAGYSTAAAGARQMGTWNETDQQQSWDQMSPTHQDMLKAVGYKPPNEKGGIFNDLQHWGADVLHNKVIGSIVNTLGAPLRVEQHAERTLFDKVSNPVDWAQAWDETANGKAYIDPGFRQQALARWGSDTYTLAYKLATGQQPQQIIRGYPQAQWSQIGTALNSKGVQDAAAYLNAGHLTEGQVVADQVLGHGSYRAGGLTEHDAFYRWLSGGIDAMMDWFGDPLVIGGKLAGAAGGSVFSMAHARFLVKDGQDVDNLFARSQSVRTQAARLAEGVRAVRETGSGAARMMAMDKRLTNAGIIQRLVEAGADTEDKVRVFFKETANLKALFEGQGWHAGDPTYIPHLSFKGQLAMKANGALTKVVRWGDDAPVDIYAGPGNIEPSALNPQGLDRIRIGTGRSISRMVRLMPTTRIFNPYAPNAMANLRDILSMGLNPRTVDRVLSEFASNPDLGARWKLYRSAMQTIGHVMGFREGTPEWDAVMGRYVSGEGRIYAPGGIDSMYVNNQKVAAGVLKAQMNDGWLIPSFKEMYTGAKKAIGVQSFFRGINAQWLDHFMGVWRPLTLARLGFALRVSGEEAFGMLLREGPLAYLRSEAANLSAHYAMRERTALSDYLSTELAESLKDPLAHNIDDIAKTDHARFYNVLKAGLSRKEELAEKNIVGLWKARMVNSVVIPLQRIGKALTVGQYRDAVDELVARGWLDHGSPFSKHLTSMHGYDPDDALAMPADNLLKAKDRGRVVPAELSGTGAYKKFAQTDDNFKRIWEWNLHQVASDDWGRFALQDHRQAWAIRKDLSDFLMQDPTWKNSVRAFRTSGGKVVGDDATLRDAAEDHAQKIIDMVGRLTKTPDHQPILLDDGTSLAEHMFRTGQAPPWYLSADARAEGQVNQLSNVAFEDMPREVSGPELVPSISGFNVRKMTDWMFRKFVSPQIDWISRQPMFVHQYAVAREELKGFAAWQRRLGNSDENVASMVHDMATNRAVNSTLPYIHNPELRSQMSQVTRNLAPFWFAQEQFYKRWARTFVYSPWAYRRAALIAGGLNHMGFIHTDPENGQAYFVYPGSALTTDVISHVLSAFGIKDEIPVEADLTGYVSMLNPGLNRGFLPNFGPVAVVPMDGLKMLDPHFTEAINGIEGGNASSSSFLSSVVPSVVLRALEATPGLGQALDPSGYASAMMSAIQYREATGEGLAYPAITQVGNGQPPASGKGYQVGDYFLDGAYSYVLQPDGTWADNSPTQMTAWLKETQQWARSFFMARLLYGFGGPASPENYFDPKGLSAQLQQLMNEMPYQQAVAAFMEMHPTATAMTVFQTADQVNGFLPSTQTGMAWLEANKAIVQRWPNASTYLMPYPDTKGAFNLAAYQEQLAEGLRTQRTPQQYWQEVVYQEAANDYYAVETYKNQLLASHQTPTAEVDQMWTRFTESFNAANPLFAQMNADTGPVTRGQIMAEVGEWLSDPQAPRDQQYTDTLQLYQAYRDWLSITGNFGQPNAPSTQHNYQVNVEFAKWVANYEQQHQDVTGLVQRVIRPDLSTTLTDMAAQGETITL
jgi:hypothetical protein